MAMKTKSAVILGSLCALMLALGLGWPMTAAAQSRQFKGMINNKLPIVMKLNFNGSSVSGAYYYEKYKTDIRLEGSLDDKGNISLTEFDPKDGNISGSFAGKFVSANRIEGRWIKGDGTKTLPFYVQEGGGGGGGGGAGSSRFVGTWYCNAEGVGRPTFTVKADGTFTVEYGSPENMEGNRRNDRGTYTVSGSTIVFRYKSGGEWSGVLDRSGQTINMDSGHFLSR
jgi:hypothetical protein